MDTRPSADSRANHVPRILARRPPGTPCVASSRRASSRPARNGRRPSSTQATRAEPQVRGAVTASAESPSTAGEEGQRPLAGWATSLHLRQRPRASSRRLSRLRPVGGERSHSTEAVPGRPGLPPAVGSRIVLSGSRTPGYKWSNDSECLLRPWARHDSRRLA